MRWGKVALVGVGLLGGSLGLALRQRRLADSVVGVVRRRSDISACETVGAADLATQELKTAVADAQIVVLCTPISQMRPIVESMLPALKRGAIVTDVGSVKAGVVKSCEGLIAEAGAHFIGSHPLAGAESSGVHFARADLFKNAICAVTRTPNSDMRALREVEKFWRSVGARPMRLSPEMHDDLVSQSSHLPHIVAAMLAKRVLDPAGPRRQALLCGGGFRDTTRIASGCPGMWCDISLANSRNLSCAIDAFVAELVQFNTALKAGSAASISRMLKQSKQRRDRWMVRAAALTGRERAGNDVSAGSPGERAHTGQTAPPSAERTVDHAHR